jgi:hypothetical protein
MNQIKDESKTKEINNTSIVAPSVCPSLSSVSLWRVITIFTDRQITRVQEIVNYSARTDASIKIHHPIVTDHVEVTWNVVVELSRKLRVPATLREERQEAHGIIVPA